MLSGLVDELKACIATGRDLKKRGQDPCHHRWADQLVWQRIMK